MPAVAIPSLGDPARSGTRVTPDEHPPLLVRWGGSRSSDLAPLVVIKRVGIENPVWLHLPLLVALATGIALVLRAVQRLHVAG